MSEDERYEVASTFLDHALGEQTVIDYVGQIEFQPTGGGVAMALLINQIIRETSNDEAA